MTNDWHKEHGECGFDKKNEMGEAILDLVVIFYLTIVSIYLEKEEHLNFQTGLLSNVCNCECSCMIVAPEWLAKYTLMPSGSIQWLKSLLV